MSVVREKADVAEALDRHVSHPDAGSGEDREAGLDFVRRGLAEGLLVPARFASKTAPA